MGETLGAWGEHDTDRRPGRRGRGEAYAAGPGRGTAPAPRLRARRRRPRSRDHPGRRGARLAPVLRGGTNLSRNGGPRWRPVVALAWLAVLWLRGAYQRSLFGAGVEEYGLVARASVLTGGRRWAWRATWRSSRCRAASSRWPFSLASPCSWWSDTWSADSCTRPARKGGSTERVVIAGNESHVDEIDAVFRREPWLGYRTVGALTPTEDPTLETASGIRVLGNVEDAAWARRAARRRCHLLRRGSLQQQQPDARPRLGAGAARRPGHRRAQRDRRIARAPPGAAPRRPPHDPSGGPARGCAPVTGPSAPSTPSAPRCCCCFSRPCSASPRWRVKAADQGPVLLPTDPDRAGTVRTSPASSSAPWSPTRRTCWRTCTRSTRLRVRPVQDEGRPPRD